MRNESRDSRRSKTGLWIGLGFCAVLLVLTGLLSQRIAFLRNAVHYVTEPVSKAFVSAEGWIYDHTKGWRSMEDLLEENEQLQEKVSALEEENRYLQNEARRTRQLEELYELDTSYRDYERTAAQIIGLSPSNWYDQLILDAGTSDGIDVFMPVLFSSGLAGHVSEVYDSYSVVTSIVSRDSVIHGQVNRQEGDLVVVQGAYGFRSNELGLIEDDLCMITFVTDETDIVVGDEIVTSTLGDIYPQGLSIGTVVEIVPIGSGFESIALVKPTAVFSRNNMVLVITTPGDQLTKDEGTDIEGGSEP